MAAQLSSEGRTALEVYVMCESNNVIQVDAFAELSTDLHRIQRPHQLVWASLRLRDRAFDATTGFRALWRCCARLLTARTATASCRHCGEAPATYRAEVAASSPALGSTP